MIPQKIDVVTNDITNAIYLDGVLVGVFEDGPELLDLLFESVHWHDRWDIEHFPSKLSELDEDD